MARTLDQILNEADDIISGRSAAQEKTASPAPSGDEIENLAKYLESEVHAQTKVASSDVEMTAFEKVAYSMAIVDTMTTLEKLTKVAAFEEKARAQGYSEAQIGEFLEKQAASEFGKKTILPAAAAALAAGAYGHSKGKEKGYNKALDDVSGAFGNQ